MPNFTLLGYDARFHIFLALFSIGGLFVFPGYLFLYYINLVVFCLISEIIFDPKFYKVFGERIKNVPVTITLVMFPINLVLGDLFALIFLFGEIVFLIYLYNKRKNMKVYNPFLEE
ncbi:hypothetical protein [Methanobrevibacter sp.]|uniref:hypothetical protein n=1 Tax=Methanobrevibacter sp. TaxID=66852 RepID=UPI00261879BF|nr:hypothetical protein [uncultured Methanobrevibacter sp.]